MYSKINYLYISCHFHFNLIPEDESTQHGVGTTIENIEQTHEAQPQDDGSYLIERPGIVLEDDVMEEEHAWSREKWTEDETKRLLVFYVDNKAAFQAGSTRKNICGL